MNYRGAIIVYGVLRTIRAYVGSSSGPKLKTRGQKMGMEWRLSQFFLTAQISREKLSFQWLNQGRNKGH